MKPEREPAGPPSEERERRSRFEEEAGPILSLLHGIALRLSGDPAEAEDLVQEALLRGFRAYDRFEPGTNFRAWIVRILTNHFLNERRHRARVERLGPESAMASAAPPRPDQVDLTPEEVSRLESLEPLREGLGGPAVRALEKVPAPFRLVFLLSSLCGLSYGEIAEALEIPMGTVMSRLYRARQLLRSALAGELRARPEGAPR